MSQICPFNTIEESYSDPLYLPPGIKLPRNEVDGGDVMVFRFMTLCQNHQDIHDQEVMLPYSPQTLRLQLVKKVK